MTEIALFVGGRRFALSCDPGEEEKVRRLAAMIDARFERNSPRYSQNLLFAALRLADEMDERGGVAASATDLFGHGGTREEGLAPALERFADRLEECAAKLERREARA